MSVEQAFTPGTDHPESATSQYSIPIQEETIILDDIWAATAPTDSGLLSAPLQQSHLDSQSGSELPQMDKWSQNQTETAGQRLSEIAGLGRHLSGWASVERAHDSGGTRVGPSSDHRLVLEEVLPRDTAVYMTSLYFDYVRAYADVSSIRLTQYRSTL